MVLTMLQPLKKIEIYIKLVEISKATSTQGAIV